MYTITIKGVRYEALEYTIYKSQYYSRTLVTILLFLLSIAKRCSHRGARLADKNTLLLSFISLCSSGNKLRLYQTLVLMTPDDKVKEVWNEGRRNIISRTVLGSEKQQQQTKKNIL